MAVIPALKTDKKADPQAQFLQDKLIEFSRGLDAPFLSGVSIDVLFDPTSTDPLLPLKQKVDHKLGRKPLGWIQLRLIPDTPGDVLYEWAGTDERKLHIAATGPSSATLWVF
jgi:hypothetical protein